MINTSDIEKIISLALASAYVEGEKPISLLLISDRPESGKTELVLKFAETPNVKVLSDITAYSLWKDFEKELMSGTIKHFIIPEFLAPLNRSNVNSLISTFQMMIEDGLKEIHTGFLPNPIKLPEPIVVGLIACMPQEAFAARMNDWAQSGFLSRFSLVSYKYSDQSVKNIFQAIKERRYRTEPKITLNLSPVKIEIPSDVADKCHELSEETSKSLKSQGKIYGFRELKNILRYVAANVILDRCLNGSTRTEATIGDYEEIERLSYLFNNKYMEVKQ